MSNFLHIRKSGDNFTRLRDSYPTYHAAVLCGQDLAGAGNFYIETSGVPTREEQLLLPPVGAKRKSFGNRTSKHVADALRELNL